jgi:hypothetical protein
LLATQQYFSLKQIIEGIRARLREIWESTLVDENTQKKFHHAWNGNLVFIHIFHNHSDHWTDWGLHEHDAYLAKMEIRLTVWNISLQEIYSCFLLRLAEHNAHHHPRQGARRDCD